MDKINQEAADLIFAHNPELKPAEMIGLTVKDNKLVYWSRELEETYEGIEAHFLPQQGANVNPTFSSRLEGNSTIFMGWTGIPQVAKRPTS